MSIQRILTSDGSHTLWNETLNAYYHSVNGALQESQSIYIDLGLKEAIRHYRLSPFFAPLTVFEMGFGTGLNALLTWLEAEKAQVPVRYVTVEAHPLAEELVSGLNYDGLLETHRLLQLHEAVWEQPVQFSPYFTLEKHRTKLQDFETTLQFDAIYYDAFAPSAQPELWEREVFEQLAALLRPNGNLTTYCSKSYVQRNLRAAGFTVEKHPGPKWKREVLRAIL
ncbi:tRNA (5-methylaminomethyl-2-thiouridine)(34)-methyltransferase MnmD [Runella salmonicolor]|uniref:tRNA (5-methylaminomethyl-2-thiouridine)(34)-methyltransferase MnmD n=1 Tax=Runella salmonicolor TaxID=2950278 RepID=A0ABT1FUV1_9BACT|nr:tRNA (5-methylaminomethyl-2-thiouridine)(34)-methyltransferase MnmD [Runella salmonicolor]MCP1385545.1 tRNA (5-methylaminomethyl-2-thiouridine)(34)-methyltransferase MnmD [Runella salmonicolor]